MTPHSINWSLLRTALAMRARQALTLAAKSVHDRSATQSFDLARGITTHLAFVPTSPGYIHASAAWTASAADADAPALKMQLIRPDGSVAADVIGRSPLALHFHLRRNEFARTRGRTYRVVLMHTVLTMTGEAAKGDFRVTWGEQDGNASV